MQTFKNNDKLVQFIKCLPDGGTSQDAPEDFKYLLFPTKQKEYELVYAGKMRKTYII